MATLNLSLFDKALKTLYAPGKIPRIGMDKHTLLGMIKKETSWKGGPYAQRVRVANSAGRSASLSAAQSAAGNAKNLEFLIPAQAKADYGVVRIDGQTIRASENLTEESAAGYISARKQEIDTTIASLNASLAHALYRNGGGARAVVGSVSSNAITLATASDSFYFEKDMVITANTNDGSGSGTARSGDMVVTKVERGPVTSVVTVDTAAASLTAGDYLFVKGDFGAKVSGLEAWIPASAPSATAFMGLDRTIDTRLGGLRYPGDAPILEQLSRARAWAHEQGAEISHMFVHPSKWNEAELAMSDRAYTDFKNEDQTIGYKSLMIRTPYGPVPLLADVNCQQNVCWALKLDDWKIISRGEVPGPLAHTKSSSGEGDQFFTMTSEDSIEGRFGYYAEVVCAAPGNSMRVSL